MKRTYAVTVLVDVVTPNALGLTKALRELRRRRLVGWDIAGIGWWYEIKPRPRPLRVVERRRVKR